MIGTSPAGRPSSRSGHSEAGFTYLGVLVLVVVLGFLSQTAVTLSSHGKRADQEAELLFRGQAYRAAVRSYYEAERSLQRFPRNLEDLLQDPRFLHKRHIRRLYADPVTGDAWILMRAPDGGISGVVSASKAAPIKRANFAKGLENFEGAGSYAEWLFEYLPPSEKAAP